MKDLNFFKKYIPKTCFNLGSLVLVMFLFSVTSCQKDTELKFEQKTQAFSNISNSDRSKDIEEQVVTYTQWVIDNVAPLVSDAEVLRDIESGNHNSMVVQAKLVSLGFSNFNDFATQYFNSGVDVYTAINSGALTLEGLELILRANLEVFDLTAIGGGIAISSGLPCYDQFVTDLALAAVECAAISIVNPIAGGVWGGVYTAHAISSFKNCINGTYPN